MLGSVREIIKVEVDGGVNKMLEAEKTCCEMSEEEQYRLLSQVIRDFHSDENNLIQILHMAQAIFGYLPLKVQQYIAGEMNMPFVQGERRHHFLFLLFHTAKRQVYDSNLPGYRLLREGRQKDTGKAAGASKRKGWGDH